jgi:hypothetical protein
MHNHQVRISGIPQAMLQRVESVTSIVIIYSCPYSLHTAALVGIGFFQKGRISTLFGKDGSPRCTD